MLELIVDDRLIQNSLSSEIRHFFYAYQQKEFFEEIKKNKKEQDETKGMTKEEIEDYK